MNLERGGILFNRTIDQCRSIGRRGGRARVRNLRARNASHVAAIPAARPSEDETARQAIERIDVLCPWLKGCELRHGPTRLALDHYERHVWRTGARQCAQTHQVVGHWPRQGMPSTSSRPALWHA